MVRASHLIFSLLLLCGNISWAASEFCVVGDTGTGKEEQYLVAEAMKKAGCQQILHTGDVVYPWGARTVTSKSWRTRFEEPYRDLIASGAIFYISLGNHDHFAAKTDRVRRVYREYASNRDYIYFPSGYYSFQIGDICFWALDTDQFDSRQIEELEESFSQGNSCRWKIAFGHHPIISSGDHGNASLSLREKLNPLLQEHIDIYFSGHDHNLADEGDVIGDDGQFRQIVSGAGAKVRKVKNCLITGCLMARSVLGFTKIRIDSRRAEIDFIDVNNQVFHTSEVLAPRREKPWFQGNFIYSKFLKLLKSLREIF